MDAVEFVKTVNRLCKNLRRKECPVYKEGICTVGFDDYSVKSIKETVSKVEQWAKDYPVKTRQDEFLKLFPNARIDNCGILDIRPCCIEVSLCGKCDLRNCDGCRREYWLEEVTDND